VILGATLARRLFSDRDPAGQRLWLPNRKTWADVAGVVGDVKLASLGEPDIMLIYVSALQQPSRSSHIVVRSSRPDADVLAEARRVVASIDPDVPVYAVLAAAFSAFTMLALAVTAIGLFGLLGHHVATRRREIAVRMSLGASPGLLRASIVRQTVVLTLAGIAVGTLLSIPAGAAVRTMIGDTGPLALTPYMVAAAVLLLVAGLAGWGPAERAARTDPAVMLRAE
jgi:putative ABC transport system permease protein